MRNGRIRLLVLALFAVWLPGCFDVVEELWLNPDGSGRARLEVILPASGVPGPVRDAASQQISEGAAQSGQALMREGKVKSVSFDHKTIEGAEHFVYDVEVLNARQLDDVLPEVLSAANLPASVMGGPHPWSVKVEQVREGELRFTQTFEGTGSAGADAGTADNPLAAFGQALASSMWSGRTFTVRVHAPRVSDTNGAWDAKGEAVEWRLDLAKVASGQQPRTEMHAELFTTRYPIALVIGGAAVVLVAVGVLASALTRRRRR